MIRIASLVLLCAISLSCVGCFTAAKEGIGAVKGPKGVYAQVQTVAPSPTSAALVGYGRFELQPFADEFAGQTPQLLLDYLSIQFRRHLVQRGLEQTAGKTLQVRGAVIYYEGIGGKADLVLGEVEEAVARVELVDAQTGAVLGRAICIGRSTDRVNVGVEKKADGLAKAIVQWIADNRGLAKTQE